MRASPRRFLFPLLAIAIALWLSRRQPRDADEPAGPAATEAHDGAEIQVLNRD
ncbi:MAG: hypothetical protein R3F49_07045 [Planctomycetota bacterium]